MAIETEILWTDSTFNPWVGCQKVGPGCDHCYAEVMDKRTGGSHWGPGAARRRTRPENWAQPVRWNNKAAAFFAQHGHRQRVFCASMADVFDNSVDPQWRRDLFELIAATPNLDWLLLTKRIGNVTAMCTDQFMQDVLREHIWLGATIVNQEEANRDVAKLLNTRASKRFLSMEPLLGPVNLSSIPQARNGTSCSTNALTGITTCPDQDAAEGARLDWVIVGGESGHGARPMNPDWVGSLRDQCMDADVAFLFKQWGEWGPHHAAVGSVEGGGAVRHGRVHYFQGDGREPDGHFRQGDTAVARFGKAAAGRMLDGVLYEVFPA
jgi:protein gp37